MASTALFCVTFKRDHRWCEYLIRSVARFASGFSHLCIATPWADHEFFLGLEKLARKDLPAQIKSYHEFPERGFNHHMVQITYADVWMPNDDFIVHVDADCIFTKPFTPETYMNDGKPVLLHQPYETLVDARGNAHAAQQWKAAAERALGFPVPDETMRRHPAIHYRDIYKSVRERMELVHRCPFTDYVLSCKNSFPQGWAEYPTIGGWVMHNCPERYSLLDVSKAPFPDNPLVQGWSQHAPGNPQHEAHATAQAQRWDSFLK